MVRVYYTRLLHSPVMPLQSGINSVLAISRQCLNNSLLSAGLVCWTRCGITFGLEFFCYHEGICFHTILHLNISMLLDTTRLLSFFSHNSFYYPKQVNCFHFCWNINWRPNNRIAANAQFHGVYMRFIPVTAVDTRSLCNCRKNSYRWKDILPRGHEIRQYMVDSRPSALVRFVLYMAMDMSLLNSHTIIY